MKTKKRIFSIFLSFVMVFSLILPFSVSANTSHSITATLEGLDSMFTGRPVTARVVFTLEGGGVFANEIVPSDFWVFGLPSGLYAAPAVRAYDDVVFIRITGSPNFAAATLANIIVPATIPARNFRAPNLFAPVTPATLPIPGAVTQSAGVSPGTITFDLNPYGEMHRDTSIFLNTREFILRNIRYGLVNLREDADFTMGDGGFIVIHRTFLERLPVGRWELTFNMNEGGNPVLIMNILDTSRETVPPPQAPISPPPLPPPAPIHPNENFMYLTGGVAVNVADLRWDLNRARVFPALHDGVASVTVRADVLEQLAWNTPDAHFEIHTPLVRARVPVDLVGNIFGGRFAMLFHGLSTAQTDVRISLIDRSDATELTDMFHTVYPNGQILTPLVELRIELLNAATGEVILRALEIGRPIHLTFVIMDNAGHLRPAGVLFQRAWLEFVPYRTFSPNEITTRTIFTGVQGLIHNRVHFEDVYLTHWGFVQSYTAAYSGLVVPMAELHPNTPITRGEFAQLLAIALQLPRAGANTSGFVDVPLPNVFFDGVSRLFQAGLLGPYVPGSYFHPNALITREEIGAIAGMALQIFGTERERLYRPLGIAFTDGHTVSPNHWHNMQTTVDFGVLVGHPDGSLRPHIPATRIDSLAVVMRLSRALGLIDEI